LVTEKRTATRLIALSFTVSALASLGLLITYIVGGQPQVEGTLIALSLGGLAVGLIMWAHDLMPASSSKSESRISPPPRSALL
jgi:quinol---cytochrome c reductase iron-sulfur subunit